MKQIKYLVFFIFLSVFTSCKNSKKSNLTLLSSEIPTDEALIYGQGVISTNNAMEFAITFNPEMSELFFTRRKQGGENEIYTMKLTEGKWSTPVKAFFTTNNRKHWDFEPHISPKGDLLYFGSLRPLNDTIKSSGMHQWYLKKEEDNWSQPIPLETPFVDRFVMYISSSEDNKLYFTSSENGKGGIYYTSRHQGQGVNITKMEKEINTGEDIAHPYIAPDESYLIFDGKRTSGFGDCDLYISFKENGVWTEAYNLGANINTEMCEMTASVSPDGKYLFFHRAGDKEDSGNIYWADFSKLKKDLLTKRNSN